VNTTFEFTKVFNDRNFYMFSFIKNIPHQFEQRKEQLYGMIARKRLKNKSFTLLSNNCWAGGVYQDLQLPYSTPTAGLFFYAPCYIRFLSRLDYYLSLPLQFKEVSVYEEANESRKKETYPLGVLNDVEIHFLHYESKEEAFEKWTRRTERINRENLYVAFSDRDGCTLEHIKAFDALPFKHKVFFSAKNIPGIQSLVWLKIYKDRDCIGDIYANPWHYRRYFDVVGFLNRK
jgi:uncharacterized protein (DUF1919 family)